MNWKTIKCSICKKEVPKQYGRQRTCLSAECMKKQYSASQHFYKKNGRIHPKGAFDEVKYREKIKKEPAWCFMRYKRGAKKRGIAFTISIEDFVALWGKPCSYCGDKIETIGIDRVDNKKGYVKRNIVPCCTLCNSMKSNIGEKVFLEQCKKIVAYGVE